MNKIYLVETKKQVDDLLDRFDLRDSKIIALSPFAMNALNLKGIENNIPEDFYTNEELWQIGLKSGDVVKELCRRLDKFALSNSKELKKRNLRLFTNYAYPLYVIFDGAFSRIFQLKAIFKHLKPDRVFCYKSEKLPFYWRGIGFDKREFLYSKILEERGWQEDIHFISLPKPKENNFNDKKTSGDFSRRINNFKHRLREKVPTLWRIKKFGLSQFLKTLPALFKENVNLALIGGEYEWAECESEFKAHGARLQRLDIAYCEEGSPPDNRENENRLLEEIGDLLIFQGTDLSSLLISRLDFIYKEGKKRCIAAHDTASNYIDNMNPRALLISSLSTPEWKSAAGAFSQRKIPCLCKPHGVAGNFRNIKIVDNELLFTNYYLAHGEEGAVSYQTYTADYAHNNLKVIYTGSPKIERLKARKGRLSKKLKKWLRDKKKIYGKNTKIVVYVTSGYLQNRSYIFFKPPFLDRTFFKSQSTIINFFKGRKDCLLIWKLHPNRIISDRPPYIEKGSDNIFVARDEMQAIDLLDIADFVVIDVPTTSCLQTVAKKIPLFAVLKHLLYFPGALTLLQKRAVCCQEPEDLMKKVEDFLLHGKYDADINNDLFLKAYGNGDEAIKKTTLEVMKIIGR